MIMPLSTVTNSFETLEEILLPHEIHIIHILTNDGSS